MHKSIAQFDPDRTAAQRRLDAEQGYALLNALAAKWWEQGYNAGVIGLNPATSTFWTPDHQRGYLAAHSSTSVLSHSHSLRQETRDA